MRKLLAHCCCASCALYSLQKIRDDADFQVAAYFYNPNIHPEGEYLRRLKDIQRVTEHLDIPLFVDEYNPDEYLQVIKGYEDDPEGAYRCALCYELRLSRTAKKAAELGFDAYTTVLTVSPHKSAPLINYFGRKYGIASRVDFEFFDLKKGGGFQESARLSKEMGLYRQSYCGCEFSMR